MSTNKILLGEKTLTCNVRSSWVCEPNMLSGWRTHVRENAARHEIKKWTRLVQVKSITPTLGSAWYGSLSQET